MQYNVWLMPYSNFGTDYNPSWGVAYKIREKLLDKSCSERRYACRIRRVGVNIYDANEAVDEVAFLDESGQLKIDVVVAIGENAGLSVPFDFEHKGVASANDISGQYDPYGRPIDGTPQAYGPKIEGKVAGWYYNLNVRDLVNRYNQTAGNTSESPNAGNYLCGYMTERLASTPTLTDKAFFVHVKDFDPTKEEAGRDEAGDLLAGFIDSFCSPPHA